MTITRASRVACFRSPIAPDIDSPNTSLSAARPPMLITSRAVSSLTDRSTRSSSGWNMVTPPACPRGMIDTRSILSAFGSRIAHRACPASWYAVRRFSVSLNASSRSAPSRTRSAARSKSTCSTLFRPDRVACRAASLHRFCSSAPLIPTMFRAIRSRSTPSDSGLFRVCTFRISSRPRQVGRSTVMCRSNRPGRSSALIEHVRAGWWQRPPARVSVGVEAVHLATESGSASARAHRDPPPKPAPRMRPDGVDLVDEHNTRGVLLGRAEQVADAAGADARRTSG